MERPPPPRFKKPIKGSVEAKEQMQRVREAQAHRTLSNLRVSEE